MEHRNLGIWRPAFKNYEMYEDLSIYYKGNKIEDSNYFGYYKDKMERIKLFAILFLGREVGKRILVFKDGNPLNIKLENLEWSNMNQETYNFLKNNEGKPHGKHCSKCKEYKLYSEYYITGKGRKSMKNSCISCDILARNLKKDIYNERRKNNRKDKKGLNYVYQAKKYLKLKDDPEKYQSFLNKVKIYRKENWWITTLSQIKRRSSDNNLPFNLTKEDLILPEFCPLLNVPISVFNTNKMYTVSWDRIIPELGYTKGNVRAISLKANIMKNNANLKELKSFAKNIIPYMENKDLLHY